MAMTEVCERAHRALSPKWVRLEGRDGLGETLGAAQRQSGQRQNGGGSAFCGSEAQCEQLTLAG